MRSLVVLCLLYCSTSGQRVRFISTEHPAVTYYNTKYISFVNLTSQRYGRGDPFYYVGLHFNVLVPLDNNVHIEFIFYEFLSNQYKRSFVQMHFKTCDMMREDNFFSVPLRQGKLNRTCPYPPGEYHLHNMSIPVNLIPRAFPFKKGRIVANLTILTGPIGRDVEIVGTAYIDMEIKEYNKRTKNIT